MLKFEVKLNDIKVGRFNLKTNATFQDCICNVVFQVEAAKHGLGLDSSVTGLVSGLVIVDNDKDIVTFDPMFFDWDSESFKTI